MAKHDSLSSSLDATIEKKIYVDDDFALDIDGHGDISYRHCHIVNVYHVPSLSENLLSISQLTQIGNIFKFWYNHFFVKYMNKDELIATEGVLGSKD